MKRALSLVASLAALSMVLVLMAGPALATTEHCPNHMTETKIEVPQGWDFEEDGPYVETVTIDGVDVTVTIDGDTVTFTDEEDDPIEVEFCLKSSNEAFDGFSGSTGTVPDGQDISYVVVYALVDTEESVEESASVEESVPASVEESVPASVDESVPASVDESQPDEESPSFPPTGGGTPPDTAMEPNSTIPALILAGILLLSLGGLLYVNVQAVRFRR